MARSVFKYSAIALGLETTFMAVKNSIDEFCILPTVTPLDYAHFKPMNDKIE